MTPDYGFSAGLAGCAAAIVSLLELRRYRQRAEHAATLLRGEVERQQNAFTEQFAALTQGFSALELNMQNTEEMLREGRLNRSTRAQALQLLRQGVAPDTAAATLGLAKREMRLLARVSRLLSAS
jgi:hypothetical protein